MDQKYREETVDAMIRSMKAEESLAALLVGLQKLGATLAEQWPHDLDNPNELSNELIR